MMESKYSFQNIEQWYEQVISLNMHWRESRRKKERLRGQRGKSLGSKNKYASKY